MKIIIECNPKIDNPEQQMFEYLKTQLSIAVKEYKIKVEGTDLEYEVKL